VKVKRIYQNRPESYMDKNFWMIGTHESLGAVAIATAEVVKLMPGAETHYHNHPDMEESYYIVCGSGSLRKNANIKQVKAGDGLFFGPADSKSIKNTSSFPLVYLSMSVKLSPDISPEGGHHGA